ncbi:MAG: aldo/keto reductase [Pseudomonadota bacterium]
MVQLRTLSDEPISALAFGTMQFGGGSDAKTSRAVFDACRAVGINTFDCAHIYCEGRSEELLGAFAKPHRDALFLTTKGGYTGGASAANLTEQFEISLSRLKSDFVDLYFLHRFDPETPLDETLGWMALEQRKGRIRFLGLSNFAAWQVMKAEGVAASLGTRIDAIQPMYNLVKRQAEVELLPMALDQDIAVFPYSPLGGGLLSGKYTADDTDGRLASDTRYRARYGEEWMWDTAKELTELARERGEHPARFAVAWAAHHPAVTAPLISARTVEQLRPSLTPLTLSDEDYAMVTALSRTPPPATDRIEEQAR